jgi:glutathione S-transferase
MPLQRLLYHFWLSPFARKIRLVLQEKNLDFSMQVEKPWERRPEFVALNPACEVPVLLEPDGTVLSDATAIAEYLDETYREKLLLGLNPIDRAEVRRLIAWFDLKMNREVTEPLVNEKFMKRFVGFGEPDSAAIRAAKANLRYHLDYIAYLTERHRGWLAGDYFSLADITAAAHLSALDYLDDVPWDDFEPAKEWYARIKSRPTFRPILADHIPGAPPAKHYTDLDF